MSVVVFHLLAFILLLCQCNNVYRYSTTYLTNWIQWIVFIQLQNKVNLLTNTHNLELQS